MKFTCNNCGFSAEVPSEQQVCPMCGSTNVSLSSEEPVSPSPQSGPSPTESEPESIPEPPQTVRQQPVSEHIPTVSSTEDESNKPHTADDDELVQMLQELENEGDEFSEEQKSLPLKPIIIGGAILVVVTAAVLFVVLRSSDHSATKLSAQQEIDSEDEEETSTVATEQPQKNRQKVISQEKELENEIAKDEKEAEKEVEQEVAQEEEEEAQTKTQERLVTHSQPKKSKKHRRRKHPRRKRTRQTHKRTQTIPPSKSAADQQPQQAAPQPQQAAPQPQQAAPQPQQAAPQPQQAAPQQSVKKAPTFIDLLNLGKIALTKGKYADAIVFLSQAKKMNPGYPPLYKYLGIAYAAQHKNKQACVQYHQYLLLAPNAKDKVQIQQAMQGCP